MISFICGIYKFKLIGVDSKAIITRGLGRGVWDGDMGKC
jgi:hypothetical protein